MKENDIPLQIFPDFFASLQDIEPTPEDCRDILEALGEYAKGNFDFVSSNRTIRGIMASFRRSAKFRHEKYLEKREKLRENGSKGGNASKIAKVQNAEIQQDNIAIATNCKQKLPIASITTTTTTTTRDKSLKSKDLNLLSLYQRESERGFEFLDLLSAFDKAIARGRKLRKEHPENTLEWSDKQDENYLDSCRIFTIDQNIEQGEKIFLAVLEGQPGVNAKTIHDNIVKAIEAGNLQRPNVSASIWNILNKFRTKIKEKNLLILKDIAESFENAPECARWDSIEKSLQDISKGHIDNPVGLIVYNLKHLE